MRISSEVVKKKLKANAEEKSNLLSVRVGTRKFVLPQNIQILQDGSHMFISFSESTDIYKLEGKNASLITDTVQASEAIQTLKSNIEKQRTKRRAKKTLEVSPELEKALKTVPKGYKILHQDDGSFKLVRSRNRKKQQAL